MPASSSRTLGRLGFFHVCAVLGLVASAVRAPLLAAQEPSAQDSYEARERLGPPDSERFPGLKRLHPTAPVWLGANREHVVLRAGVCLRQGPIELFACNHRWIKNAATGELARHGTKEYESIVTIGAPPSVIHAGLLAVGAKSGSPVQFEPEYRPATGSVVEITLHWETPDGKHRQCKAQDWIRNGREGKPLQHDWVFAGSRFQKDPTTGRKQYQADRGNVICVSNFGDAMLDLPIKSTQVNSALFYEAFTENIPPVGTAVTVVLKPRKEKAAAAEQKGDASGGRK